METIDSPNSPTRRRWLTFSLAGLLTFMFVACVGFAWFGFIWRAKQKERAAVAALEEVGGNVTYGYQLNEDGGLIDPSPDPPGPSWLRSLLGEDWFAAPHVLVFDDAQVAFDAAGELIELKQVSDADLVHLREFRQLQELRLDRAQVSDAGLAHFHELKQLQRLSLAGTQISDAGLAHLRELKRL
ncbi:MAG: hypothetical protein N2C14_13280, partial [Planctomycetales bacterium]